MELKTTICSPRCRFSFNASRSWISKQVYGAQGIFAGTVVCVKCHLPGTWSHVCNTCAVELASNCFFILSLENLPARYNRGRIRIVHIQYLVGLLSKCSAKFSFCPLDALTRQGCSRRLGSEAKFRNWCIMNSGRRPQNLLHWHVPVIRPNYLHTLELAFTVLTITISATRHCFTLNAVSAPN